MKLTVPQRKPEESKYKPMHLKLWASFSANVAEGVDVGQEFGPDD